MANAPDIKARFTTFGRTFRERLAACCRRLRNLYDPAPLAIPRNYWTVLVYWVTATFVISVAFYGVAELITGAGNDPGAAQAADQSAGSAGNVFTGLAAFTAAIAALVGLAFKLVSDEITRAETVRRKRIDLSLALYAEILSNIEQQRRSLHDADNERYVDDKLSPVGVKSHKAEGPVETEDSKVADMAPKSSKSGGLADRTNVMFAKAIENYEFIPSGAIISVVKYYNLNEMMNNLIAYMASPKFEALKAEQRIPIVNSYYELAEKVDEMGCLALNKLKSTEDDHEKEPSSVRAELGQPDGQPFKFKDELRQRIDAKRAPQRPDNFSDA